MYAMYMTDDALPLPYEIQEMTTTEARKRLPELVNMAAYGHVTTVLVRDGRRLARIVSEEDAWIYSQAWQDKLRESESDVAAGRVPQRTDIHHPPKGLSKNETNGDCRPLRPVRTVIAAVYGATPRNRKSPTNPKDRPCPGPRTGQLARHAATAHPTATPRSGGRGRTP